MVAADEAAELDCRKGSDGSWFGRHSTAGDGAAGLDPVEGNILFNLSYSGKSLWRNFRRMLRCFTVVSYNKFQQFKNKMLTTS
jgi:hypothetical protein